MKHKFKTAAIFTIAVLCMFGNAFAQTIFYGATKITVPSSKTSINLKTETMYRILAWDDIDGDISDKITINGGNWNVSVPTTVTYSVTNSRGRTENQTVQISHGGSLPVVERTVYHFSQAAIDYAEVAKMLRGDNHDKQHLGIYLPGNANFRVRRVSGNAALQITIYCGLLDTHSPDRSTTLPNGMTAPKPVIVTINNNEWQTITNTNTTRGGVPMLKTPRYEGDALTKIEVEISSNARDLN
jgi:hypothetical protein